MSIIDLEDAVRAAKDRPSMEKELQELREQTGQLREDLKIALADNERLRGICVEVARLLWIAKDFPMSIGARSAIDDAYDQISDDVGAALKGEGE